jgi:hypothetical protein
MRERNHPSPPTPRAFVSIQFPPCPPPPIHPTYWKKETADNPLPETVSARQPAVSHPPPPLLVLRTSRLLKETKANKPIINASQVASPAREVKREVKENTSSQLPSCASCIGYGPEKTWQEKEERVVCSRHLTAPAQSRPQSTDTAPGVPSDAGAAPQDPRAHGPGPEQARCA